MEIPSKCEEMCILRVFPMMRGVLESEESVVDAKSDYIESIVYCIWMQYC